MHFRKPQLRVKAVNLDFSAKSLSTDYNESNKPTLKSPAHIKSEKSLVELGVPKIELLHFFTFFALLKSLLFIMSHIQCKLSSTDYNELTKPNPKSLAYVGSKKSLVKLGVPKNELFHFFHIFSSTEKFSFSP